jgi:hypothetical protein
MIGGYSMKFFDFYSHSKFALLERGTSNWDYYTMQYSDDPPCVVAIAKPGTGADDCLFGDMRYFKRWKEATA